MNAGILYHILHEGDALRVSQTHTILQLFIEFLLDLLSDFPFGILIEFCPLALEGGAQVAFAGSQQFRLILLYFVTDAALGNGLGSPACVLHPPNQ